MGIFDFWRKSDEEIDDDEELPKPDDQISHMRRELAAEKRQYAREALRLDLEKKKAEMELAKIELQNQIEEAQMRREIAQAERQNRMAELFGDDDESEPNTADAMLVQLLGKVLNQQQPQPQPTPQTTPISDIKPVTLTDDQIKARWGSASAHEKAIAARMSDDDLKVFIQNNIPNIDAPSIARVIEVVRGKK